MPYHKVRGHSGCPSGRPWAVVKDSDGEVMGCHPNESSADRQIAALHANEPEASNQEQEVPEMARGRGSQLRRHERRSVEGVESAHEMAASGSTDLPLSDRERAWDAGAAEGRIRSWAGAEDAPNEKYATAFFWKDSEGGDLFGDYKLGFADIIDGTETAVWRGVTAAAGALSGARGGVNIPQADESAVKSRVASYYRKAAQEYDDPTITPPWEAAEQGIEGFAYALTDAELGRPAGEESVGAYEDRFAFWLDALQHGVRCQCGHVLAEHNGGVGACSHEDGRGACSCSDFAEMVQEGTQEAATLAEEEPEPDVAPETVVTGRVTLRLQDVELTGIVAAPTVELPPEHMPGEAMPDGNGNVVIEDAPAASSDAGAMRWVATLAPEGRMTDDGRAFAPDSIDWRELPLSLMAMTETSEGGHVGAEVAGRIDNIYREGSLIRGEGVFDAGEYGQEVARLVSEGTLRGVSVDIAVHEYEFGAQSDYFDEDGNWAPKDPEERDGEPPSILDVLFGDDEDEDFVFVVTKGTIGAATVCPFQAFADATIELAASLQASAQNPMIWTVTQQAGWVVVAGEKPEAGPLTAAAAGLAPVKPPAAWFEDPKLEALTPLTITDDGRIFGHAWAWETCHIGIPDVCTTAPHSAADYAYFHLGEVECDDGQKLPVGKVTLDTGHADLRASRVDTVRHYDDTGTVAAHVRVGEDAYGGWVAGAISPELSEEKVRVLRGAVLSGDWRGVNGNRELVALLAVNVPGFPVPRTRALVASADDEQEVVALIAAGLHNGETTALSKADLAKIEALADIASGEFARLAERAQQDG